MASTPIDPDRIAEAVTAAHARHRKNRRGKNAGYIPVLAEVDPQLFGVCVATVDGQTFSAGDARCQFALESISKVFTAALAMEQVGPRAFHRKVGADPTGAAFNSVLALELHNDKPMSPIPTRRTRSICSGSAICRRPRCTRRGSRSRRIATCSHCSRATQRRAPHSSAC